MEHFYVIIRYQHYRKENFLKIVRVYHTKEAALQFISLYKEYPNNSDGGYVFATTYKQHRLVTDRQINSIQALAVYECKYDNDDDISKDDSEYSDGDDSDDNTDDGNNDE